MKLSDHPFPSLFHLSMPSPSSLKFRELDFFFQFSPVVFLFTDTIIPGTIRASAKGCCLIQNVLLPGSQVCPGLKAKRKRGTFLGTFAGLVSDLRSFSLLPLGSGSFLHASSCHYPQSTAPFKGRRVWTGHLVDPSFLGAEERGCSVPFGGSTGLIEARCEDREEAKGQRKDTALRSVASVSHCRFSV